MTESEPCMESAEPNDPETGPHDGASFARSTGYLPPWNFGKPRRKGRKRALGAPNKHQRYRQKCITEGRCPHCGEPCAPFYECFKRRIGKLIGGELNRLVRINVLQKISRGVFRKAGDNAD